MKLTAAFLLVCIWALPACTNNNGNATTTVKAAQSDSSELDDKADKRFVVNADSLTSDFMLWYTYTYHTIRLTQNFIGLDVDSVQITKPAFLNMLSNQNQIAVKIAEQGGTPVYRLYASKKIDPAIQRVKKEMAQNALTLSKKEGKELPKYDFVDLNGTRYNKSNTEGKLLVIKCWFINCVACVKEFPELNKLVEEYSTREDIVFISLATDKGKDLKEFLTKRPFHYAVVPEMGAYIQDKLSVTAYPTHLLVGKDGKIIKVTNSIDDLLPSLEKEVR